MVVSERISFTVSMSFPSRFRRFVTGLTIFRRWSITSPIDWATSCAGRSSEVAPGSLEALARHRWPGNIRELENVLRRAIILSRDGLLDLSDFVGEPIDDVEAPASFASRVRPLAEAERDHVNFVLEQAGWRVEGLAGAAELLGLKPSTLRSRMQKLGIERLPTARPNRSIGAVAHS